MLRQLCRQPGLSLSILGQQSGLSLSSITKAVGALGSDGTRTMAELAASRAPPFPRREWGHPSCFWWVPRHCTFYCRLCWRYVDDSHVGSYWHLRRARASEFSARLQYASPVDNAGFELVGYTIVQGRVQYRVPYRSGVSWADVVYEF